MVLAGFLFWIPFAVGKRWYYSTEFCSEQILDTLQQIDGLDSLLPEVSSLVSHFNFMPLQVAQLKGIFVTSCHVFVENVAFERYIKY